MPGEIRFISLLVFFGSILPVSAAEVSITVSGIVPNGTNVYVALCSGALEPIACGKSERRQAQSSTMKIILRDVTPGRYAVAAYQDMNGNGTMERSRLGLPLEPYAFSNDAGRIRRPTFEAAEVSVGPTGRDFQLHLRSIKTGSVQ